MKYEEHAIRFSCHGAWLYGIVSLPSQPLARGVLIVPGGPQYRVGSHRQFTLLARYLASHGVPSMRFDYRGMGDSEGEPRTFESVEADLHHAVDRFFEEVPRLKELVIWGLCDAASAAAFYAYRDSRVAGLVLLNPWVRSDKGIARAYLQHYYVSRLFMPEFWRKVVKGEFNYASSLRTIFKLAIDAASAKKNGIAMFPDERLDGHLEKTSKEQSLSDRMYVGLSRFKGRLLLIVSGQDLTAQEFSDLVEGSRNWRKLLTSPRVRRRDLMKADHTFSRREWSEQVATWTEDWIRSW